MDIAIDEVLYFDAICHNPSTGAVSDADSAPSYDVFEENTDTAIQNGTMTKRTSKTGNYRASETLSTANGYEVGKWYTIVGSATVNSVSGKAVLKHFRCVSAEAVAGQPIVDVGAISGSATAADNLENIYLNGLAFGTVDDVSPSASSFDTDLTEVDADAYNKCFLLFLGGTNKGISRPISDYSGTAAFTITLSPAFTAAPADTDPFVILGHHP